MAVKYELGQNSKREFGKQAESAASKFLIKQGLVLEQKNFHCRNGEIDLILKDKDVLVFVEVRWHKDKGYGDSAQSITKNKRQKIIRAAKYYLLENNLYDQIPCRFDVVALSSAGKLEWIKDAFWA